MTRSEAFKILEREAKRRRLELSDQNKTIKRLGGIARVHQEMMRKIRTFHSKSFIQGGLLVYDHLVAEQRRRKALE